MGQDSGPQNANSPKKRPALGPRLVATVGAVALVAVIAAAVAYVLSRRPQPGTPPSMVQQPRPVDRIFGAGPQLHPEAAAEDGFVGSAACQSCHQQEFETWHASYHRTMTQVASPASVQGDFDDVELELDERNYRLFRRGNEFWVELDNPEWEPTGATPERTTRKVTLCTGSHHMQLYWLSTSQGRELAALPFVWLIAEERWVPRLSAFLSPPLRDVNLTDIRPRRVLEVGRWNSMCILCHTTHGQPQINQYPAESKVAEFGIACEACHGPGKNHVRAHNGLESESQQALAVPASLDHARSSEVCGQCHSVWHAKRTKFPKAFRTTGMTYRPGDDLRELREIVADGEDGQRFWRDGMVRVVGREFSAMIESPCFQRGKLSCFSCHQMHPHEEAEAALTTWREDQLKPLMRGDAACIQCHQKYQAAEILTAHTFHSTESAGSRCQNCHMPHSTYGLLKMTRAHQISTPSVQETQTAGRMNACNLCHLDKSLDWSGSYLNKWYGQEHSTTGVSPEVAQSILTAIRGDAAARAMVAWHYGWPAAQEASGSGWLAPFLAILVTDPYDAVRIVATRSLARLKGYEDLAPDLLASPEEQQRAYQLILERWEQQAHQPASELLIEKTGRLDREAVNRLLEQRDQTPITLAE